MGHDHGVLFESEVDLRDVGSGAAYHRPLRQAGLRGTLQASPAYLPHSRALALPSVHASLSTPERDFPRLQEHSPQDQSGRRARESQVGIIAHLYTDALVDSVTARITISWPQTPWGRKRYSHFPYSIILHTKHISILEVLHGVLYPEAHNNGCQKKKRDFPISGRSNSVENMGFF
jgi:hypothetical protein